MKTADDRSPQRARRTARSRDTAAHTPSTAAAPRPCTALSKGMDQKKEQKKKPAKTGKEKKAEKRDKKTAKGFAPV